MPQIFFTDYVTPATSKMLFVRDFGWHRMPANVDRSEGIGPFYQILISVSGKGQLGVSSKSSAENDLIKIKVCHNSPSLSVWIIQRR